MKTAQRKAARSKHARRHSRDDLVATNPIAQAMVRQQIEGQIRTLRTRAGIQAYMGGDVAMMAHECGRLVYVVAHAARLHGLHESPEARILAGTASALGDIVAIPATLETNRPAVVSGLAACERLLPQLHTWALTAGSLELDRILSQRDFTTGDVRAALCGDMT